LLPALALIVVSVGAAAAGAPGAPSVGATPGFRALSGGAAAAFALPADVTLARRVELAPLGLTYERYQQQFGAAKADVDGGQLTLLRDASGRIRTVIGSLYPAIVARNRVSVAAADARERARADLGNDYERTSRLMIDPVQGRYFWLVESRRLGSRWFHRIDAQGGNVLRRDNALATDHGTGVKGDTKSLVGLTRPSGGQYELSSPDDRQTTLDALNSTFFLFQILDADNHWLTPGRTSPGQPAAVDAQFYAKTTDVYYLTRFGFDWFPCYPPTMFSGPGMRSAVHYAFDYNNAFFDGRYTAYGDGDGVMFRELSGGLDVVAHEHTHGVTNCTSQLTYSGEPGALNEAFSDMIGSSAEFFANEPTVSADWVIGEDVYLPADTVPGFRNMGDPEEDGDPDHYLERYTGPDDNGGVHTNSGIPNHAFYLLVNGGMNASCAAPATHNAAHCTDADTQDNGIVVTPIGVADAERITFLAYTSLPTNATMCNARSAMEAAADALFGAASQQRASTTAAYVAVGLTDAACGIAPPPPPPPNTAPTADNKSVTTGFGTPLSITLSGSDQGTCELAFVVSQPANGTLGSVTPATCTAGSPNTDSASVTYTPNAGFSGSDSFTYTTNDGSLDSAAATVSIGVSSQPTMHIGDLDGSRASNGKTWTASVAAKVDDEAHAAVAGATMTGTWSGGATGTASCVTAATGRCTVSKSGVPKKAPSVTFTVTGVTHATRVYAPGSNHDPDADSDGTRITVPKP
jgi:Zn-dependent metalloprotease